MFKKKKYTIIREAISKDLASFVANYFSMQKQVCDTCKVARYFSPFENILGEYENYKITKITLTKMIITFLITVL